MEYLSQKGIEYVEKNVGKSPEARQELVNMGTMALPVLLIGNQRLTGFNPGQIDAALKAAGLMK
jgi:glutaredoxin